MFFPFTNYKKISVNVTFQVAYTTTARSMIYFEHSLVAGSRAYFGATGGGLPRELAIFGFDTTEGGTNQFTNILISRTVIVPAGVDIERLFADSNETIAGTLHVFEMPPL